MKHERPDLMAEWLEADGLGGFSSGTVSGRRTRRHHAWLNVAPEDPGRRVTLVQGADVWVETPEARLALSSQLYAPDVIRPDGAQRLARFTCDPWPKWRFELENGLVVEQELFARRGAPLVAVSWRLLTPDLDARLLVRPLFSGRDAHALMREGQGSRWPVEAESIGRVLRWKARDGGAGILLATNGDREGASEWHRGFVYAKERRRGHEATEDLASPGVTRFDLSRGEAVMIFAADKPVLEEPLGSRTAVEWIGTLRALERERRAGFANPAERAADAYLVERFGGKSLLTGYPWYGERGRAAFIDDWVRVRGLSPAAQRAARRHFRSHVLARLAGDGAPRTRHRRAPVSSSRGAWSPDSGQARHVPGSPKAFTRREAYADLVEQEVS